MAEPGFDEWEYLEKQLEQKANVAPELEQPKAKEERSRDRSKERRSSRERSRERKHRSRDDRDGERDKDKDRRRDRDYRESRGSRRRSRSPRRAREPTPPEVRLAREKERELKELERSVRTVFAYNLSIKADERDIWEFFSKAGDINDIRLITDRHTKRSKGLAYIEFAVQDSIYAALALSGQTMNGQAIMVKTAEAEKNLAWEAQQAAKQNATDASSLLGAALLGGLPGAAPPGAGPCKLQVNGFAPGLGEEPLKQLFAPFGAIDKVELVRDAAGTPVGYGYITFKNYGEGMTAQAHWHGKQFLNSTLTVEVAPVAPAEGGPTITPAGEIDDEDAGGGLKLSSQARTALMNRLAGSAGMPTAPLPGPPAAAPPLAPADAALLLEQGVLGPPSPIPTPCLLLKNMFDPSEAGDDPAAFEVELKEDVGGEASKFGELLHIYVDLDTPNKPFVYLKFGATEAAQAAHKALNGRFYSGKQIMVEYQFLQVYNSHFQV